MLVQIDYELRFDAPFHLGTGVTAGQIDRTVIRDAGGYLYVPASTFKGVLREHCEQLCRFYLPNSQPPSPHDSYAALAQFGKAPSLITRIFGSPLSPGGLRFDDALLDEGEKKKYEDWKAYKEWKEMQTSVATQVRIDRVTRTAADEALYTSEFGTRDHVFIGKIKGSLDCTPVDILRATQSDEMNLPTPTYSLLVLLAGLLMIERLGGNKSTGKGQCRCIITGLWLDGKICTEQWPSWIEHLDDALNTYPDEGGNA